MKKIVVIGSVNIDLVVKTSRTPNAGETIHGEDFNIFPGGKGANQAAAVAKLGGHVNMVGRVGDDAFGPGLVENLAKLGVGIERLRVEKGLSSGTALIIVDDQGENRIIVIPGANKKVAPEDVNLALPMIKSADYLLMQFEIPLSTVEYGIDMAKTHGLRVILNPAPAQTIQPEILQKVDHLILNEVEASMLTGKLVSDIESAKAATRDLLKRGAGVVALTLGRQGVIIASADDCQHVPAFPVKAVDTTAAGDAFIGGFTVALSEGKSLMDAAMLGNAAGGLAATKAGAQSSLPFRDEVENFLQNQS